MKDTDHSQIEVFAADTFEDVAARLVASAPASAVWDGIEVRVDVGQTTEDVVRKYTQFRQRTDTLRHLDQFAISTVELVAAESPGPGGKIDPWREIRDPQAGHLYILWERRQDHTVGTVGVVACVQAENSEDYLVGATQIKAFGDGRQALALHVQHAPVVNALGSLLVEHSYRFAAAEARIGALEQTVSRLLRGAAS